jgi:lipoate-protein ligase A
LERLRVIEFATGTPWYNMALDEAIARKVGSGESGPTLRLYGWSPEAVSIGYFQEVREEVNLEFCRRMRIEVVRRLTGGGSVVHSRDEMTYSLTIGEGDPMMPMDVQESYRIICTPIVSSLRRLGADASFRPVNDIEVGGRKISGSAQTRRFGAVLQHGTILLDLDNSLLSALKVSTEKLKGKGVATPKDRVTTLRQSLGRPIGHQEIGRIIAEEFGRTFRCEAVQSDPSHEEESEAHALEGKYRSQDWLFRR